MYGTVKVFFFSISKCLQKKLYLHHLVFFASYYSLYFVYSNSTLLSLPFPVIDVAESLNRADRAKTLAALTEVRFIMS